MKKREYMKDCFINDELFIDHLEQRAQEGWLLDSMNDFILTYKHIKPQNLKFQIDYNEVTEEYENILNDLGYIFAAFLDGKYVYYNEDMNADDLYNDEKTMIISKMHRYKPSKIMFSLLLALLSFLSFFIHKEDMLYLIYQYSFSQFLSHPSFYISIFMMLFSTLYWIYQACYQITMYRHYQKCLIDPDTQQLPILFLKLHTHVEVIFIPLFLSWYISFFFSSDNNTSLICYLVFFDLIMISLIYYLFSTKKHYYKLFLLFSIVIVSFNITLYNNHQDLLHSINKPLYYQNNVKKTFLKSSNDLFVNQQFIMPYHYDYYERYATCLNKEISYILFKQEIIELERETRKGHIIDEYQQSGKQYDESLYPLYSFDNALKNMKSYSSSFIDQAYYNDKYFICIKDSQFLSFLITDEKNIDDILNYYFSTQE